MKKINKIVRIAVVGKYFATGGFTLADSYISVIQAVKHAGWSCGVNVEMKWIDSETYEKEPQAVKELSKFDGLIVPGGFGTRGIEGIIMAIRYARENKLPYLGLCYGLQLAVVEFSRNVLGHKDSHTVECDPQSHHLIININPRQAENVKHNRYGGTMRLGAYRCVFKKNSKTRQLYGADEASERHRHRYEFDNKYREDLEKNGMSIAGVNPETDLVEMIELRNHPFFIGTQFHPEFKSRPLGPHPLFVGLIKAAMK